MSRPATIYSAIKAAQKAGLAIGRVIVDPETGRFVLVPKNEKPEAGEEFENVEWKA